MAKGIDIYRNGEVIRQDVPITESATHKATLMKEDYIKLSFSDVTDYKLKSGDYILVKVEYGSYKSDLSGAKFVLADDYYPTMDNEATYRYELQFNAPWYNLDKYLLLFLTETPINGNTYVTRRESDWEFTGTADELISIIIKNTRLTSLYNTDGSLASTRECPCVFSSVFYCEPTEVKSFSFSSTDVISALNQMSSTYELEWWVERLDGTYVLHFGECDNSIVYNSDNSTQFNEDGTRVKDATKQVELTMGENISKPSVKQNEALKRYYFVYGSSRNIDQSITDLDINAIATKRLSLNNPIDKGTGSGEEVVIFEDIYPKSDYQITRVDSYETESETISGYDESGNPIYATYTVYQVYLKAFSDMVMNLIATDENVQNIEDIVAAGKKLSVKFITHDYNGTTVTPLLAGWEFEVGAALKTGPSSQWYELQLLHQEINGYVVPNKNLYPKGVNNGTATDLKGNKTTIQGAGDAADWVCVYNIKGAYVDADETSNAKAELEDAFNKYYANKKKNISYTVTPYVDTDINLALGDAVKLTYGGEVVVSRVNSFTKHLDYIVDSSYELCSYTNKGSVSSLKDEVKVLNAVVNSKVLGGGIDANAVADIITTVGNKRYLRKDTEDSAAKRITFESGVRVKGVAEMDDFTANTGEIGTVITDSIRSNNYSAVSGFSIESGEYSVINVDKLNVRKRATFNELDIKSIKHVGGAMVISPASCTIAKVDIITGGYKCYFSATDGERTINNEWKVGDQAICKSFNLAANHYYWRKVTDVSSSPVNGYHYIVLSITDRDADSEEPLVGDDVICLGNRTDTDRQAAIVLDSEGTGAPILLQLDGINSYSIGDSNIVTQLSKANNIIRGQQIEVVTMSGNKSMQDFADEALKNAKGYTDKREEFLQTQITANANDITLKADKTLVDGIEDRVTKAEASIKVNADGVSANAKNVTALGNRLTTAETNIKVNSRGLASVVSKQEKVGVEYPTSKWQTNSGFDYFVINGTNEYYVVESNDPQSDYDNYTLLTIENVSAGDKIHIEGNNMFVHIIGCDGDYQGAEDDFAQEYPTEAGYYNVLGFGDDHYSDDGVSIIDWVATSNWAKVYIMLTDDNPSAYQTAKTTLIRSAYTSESRIKQTAEEIELKVGNAGIDINNKQITLSASNTIVKGDLSVQKVITYYPNGSVKSAYNGNGNGTIVYYYPIESSEAGYPFGQQMRVDDFEYDINGNAVGMKTIYYKQSGEVAWTLTSSGLQTTLNEYWSYLYDRVFDTDLVSLKAKIDRYKMNLAANLPNNISDFSQFHSTTQTDKDGRIVKGRMHTSALPPLKDDGYYSGVLCLSQAMEVPIMQDGTSAPKNKYYPYWVVSKGIITEQGNYYFAP